MGGPAGLTEVFGKLVFTWDQKLKLLLLTTTKMRNLPKDKKHKR